MIPMETDFNSTDQIKTQEKESRQIQRVAAFGFFLNLALTAMKAVLAFLSGSLAITASTIDSATDSIASLVLYFGLKLSDQKTSTFPLGLYKIENLLSVIIAFFIFFAGYEILHHTFFSPVLPPDISLTAILLILAGTISIFAFGQYVITAGRRTESPTLIAEGRHRQTDVLSSVVVLISISLSYFDLEIGLFGLTVDQIATILVLLFVARTGWELLSDGMRVLLDASLDHKTLTSVRKIIESELMVSGVRSLVGRNAGRFRFLQAVVTMRTDNLKKAHEISDRIEGKIQSSIPRVERVIIHYEPHNHDNVRIAFPLSDKDGTLGRHFGDSPYFAIVEMGLKDHRIVEREVVRNPYLDLEKGKGIQVAEWLVQSRVDRLVLVEEIKSKGPGYVFTNAGVKIQMAAAKSLEEALSGIVEKGLSES